MLYLVVFKLCWTSYLSHSSLNTISLEYTIIAPPFSKMPCGRHWNSLPQFGQNSLEDVPSPYFLFNSVTTQLNWLKCHPWKSFQTADGHPPYSFLIDSCSSSNDNFSALSLPSELFKTPWRWSPWKSTLSSSEAISNVHVEFRRRKTKLFVLHCVPRVLSHHG